MIKYLLLLILLVSLYSCPANQIGYKYESCEDVNQGIRDILKRINHPVCQEDGLCDESGYSYCRTRYPEMGRISTGECIDEMFGYLTPSNGIYSYGCDNNGCTEVTERDYKKILTSQNLEFTTPYCSIKFTDSEREACINTNLFLINRLRKLGGDEAEVEIEKHKVVFVDRFNNYCIERHTENQKKNENSYSSSAHRILYADFEKLKTFVGKEILFKDCKN